MARVLEPALLASPGATCGCTDTCEARHRPDATRCGCARPAEQEIDGAPANPQVSAFSSRREPLERRTQPKRDSRAKSAGDADAEVIMARLWLKICRKSSRC